VISSAKGLSKAYQRDKLRLNEAAAESGSMNFLLALGRGRLSIG